MSDHYLLIDGNNVMFGSQHGASTKLSAGGKETTAVFGFLGSLRLICEKFPGSKPIVLWDAPRTWRHEAFADYKGKRDQNPTTAAAKEAVKAQRPNLMEGLSLLGVRQLTGNNYEADDLGGYFARRLTDAGHTVTVVTNDRDWLQLAALNPGIVWYDQREHIKVGMATFNAHTGYENALQFVQAKALQGDTSDNLAGVGGLGEGAALAIMQNFGSVVALRDQFRANPECCGKGTPLSRYRKKIEAFFTPGSPGWDIFLRNLKFMDLRNVQIPADAIKAEPSYCDMKQFVTWLASNGMTSIAMRANDWAAVIHTHKTA